MNQQLQAEQTQSRYAAMTQAELIRRCMNLSRQGHELPDGVRTAILRHEKGKLITVGQRSTLVGLLVKMEVVV